MKSLFLRWLVLTLAVFLAASIVPGIHYTHWKDLLVAGLVLGILNTLLKPILTLLSLPFIILTLGLFLVVVNALTLSLTGWLVPGFDVQGFWPAILGSLIISLVNLFLGENKKKSSRSTSHEVRKSANPGPSSFSAKKDQDVIDI
jgi:putative membrane protein